MTNKRQIVISGGAGFAFGHITKRFYKEFGKQYDIVVIDKLNYASDLANLRGCYSQFHKFDIANTNQVKDFFAERDGLVASLIHGAAESSVDKALSGPEVFIDSNVKGTLNLLEACKKHNISMYYQSTDEVFGAFPEGSTESWNEDSPVNPRNVYSVSKCAGEQLVNAYANAFGIRAIVARSCNIYGPNQDLSKFIPKAITSLLEGKKVPIFGSGKQERQWIYVDDYVDAVMTILKKGKTGTTYNIGSASHRTNIGLVATMVVEMQKMHLLPEGILMNELVEYIPDRLGHDFRYSLTYDKLKGLGWSQKTGLSNGLEKTIEYYKAKYDQR